MGFNHKQINKQIKMTKYYRNSTAQKQTDRPRPTCQQTNILIETAKQTTDGWRDSQPGKQIEQQGINRTTKKEKEKEGTRYVVSTGPSPQRSVKK